MSAPAVLFFGLQGGGLTPPETDFRSSGEGKPSPYKAKNRKSCLNRHTNQWDGRIGFSVPKEREEVTAL